MNPLSLRAENYRSFRELELELPEGCVAIVGENGSGKSSVVNVIDLALFGPAGRSLAPFLSDDAVGDLMLELTFDHAGELYRVRRGYSPAGRGRSWLDFELLEVDSDWLPLTRETQAATQALIEQTLGLTRETFRASAFLAQSDGAAFTEAAPRDRKRVLAEVLGLDVWDRLHKRVHVERLAAASRVEGQSLRLQELEEELERLPQIVDACRVDRLAVNVAQKELEEATALHEKLRAQVERDLVDVERRRRIEVIVSHCSDELERLEEQGRKALEAHEWLTAARKELDSLPTPEAVGLLLRAQELFSRREIVVARKEETALAVTSITPEQCPTCGQTISLEQYEDLVRAARDLHVHSCDNFDRLVDELADLALRFDLNGEVWAPSTVARELERARAADVKRAEYAARSAAAPAAVDQHKLKAARKQLASAKAELAALGPARPAAEIEALEAQLADRAHAVSEAGSKLTANRDSLVRHETERDRLGKVEKWADDLRAELARAHSTIGTLEILERAFSPNGVPALLVEQAVPQIEAEASRILAELGATTRVELHTQRELKSGDGLVDALDVYVIGDNGRRPYETFSGGEKTRVNLALRIALARLLSHRRGSDSRVLVVDEPEFLDEPGTEALANVLRTLGDDFSRIYLVSHVPTLRSAFDQTITVERVDGRSRLHELEAVPA